MGFESITANFSMANVSEGSCNIILMMKHSLIINANIRLIHLFCIKFVYFNFFETAQHLHFIVILLLFKWAKPYCFVGYPIPSCRSWITLDTFCNISTAILCDTCLNFPPNETSKREAYIWVIFVEIFIFMFYLHLFSIS